MKKRLHAAPRAAVAAIAMFAAGAASAAGGPTSITASKHNFQLNTNAVYTTSSEDGVCVFCHTPHKGASSLLLWNHQLSANDYSWKDVGTGGRTTGGTTYPTNLRTWSGSTKKCLSCHDGTVSVGAIYWSNATDQTSHLLAMAGSDQTGGKISNTAYIIPAGQATQTQDGTDLSGNHPVGVPYSYGNVASTYNGITTGANVRLNQWVSAPGNGDGTGVKIFGAGGAGGPVAGSAGIECASCHDPHGTGNEFFLRVTKSGSQLCLSCHVK